MPKVRIIQHGPRADYIIQKHHTYVDHSFVGGLTREKWETMEIVSWGKDCWRGDSWDRAVEAARKYARQGVPLPVRTLAEFDGYSEKIV